MINEFIEDISKVEMDHVFNPYKQVCEFHDDADSFKIRQQNLRRLIEAAAGANVKTMWFGRDLGYLGGRRTGIALTDEVHLKWHAQMIPGLTLKKATVGPEQGEKTANMTWKILRALNQPVFLWNIFPFHPHSPSNQLSNRCHTRAERKRVESFTRRIIEILKPNKIIAVGNDAATGLIEAELAHVKVRHPSYGGKADFVSGLEREYGFSLEKRNPSPEFELA